VARGGGRLPAANGEYVHLPGILVQGDPGRFRHPLPLVHQIPDQQAQIAGLVDSRELTHVRQVRERGDRVDGGVEDELRPLGGAQVREGAGA
jgi:hypothetical protein